MKKSPVLYKVLQKLTELVKINGGVFSTAELFSIIATSNQLQNARMIQKLCRSDVITRIQRGIYVSENFDLKMLATRLQPNCAISMDSALAAQGFIGTISEQTLSTVYPGRKKIISTPNGVITFHSLSPELFFGYKRMPDSTQQAEPEKAYIDLLYYYVKGEKYAIDPLQEVNTQKLDKKKVKRYLKKYKNQKFTAFILRSLA